MNLELKPGFSLANAQALVQLAAEAYVATPTILDQRTDTQVVITELDNAVVVAFRGTSSFVDFVTDAKAWRVQRQMGDEQIEIHAGFCVAIEAVIDRIIEQLRRIPAKPIFATGHSLGGALAVLLAVYLRKAGLSAAGIYTFGQPRVGNKAFARYAQRVFGDRHFWFEDEADAIARLPGLLIGYRHSGHCEFLSALGGREEDPVLWLKILSDAWEIYQVRRVGPVAVLGLLNDHHVKRYADKIQNLT